MEPRGAGSLPAVRALIIAAAVGLLAGCPAPVEPPAWCESPTRFDYAPDHADGPSAYPDDFWTLPADTPTGLQVHVETPSAYGDTDLGSYTTIFDHLNELDGWGTTAGIVMPFTRTLGSVTPADVAIVSLPADGSPGTVTAADVRLTDWDQTAILLPRLPLASGTLHAAAIFTSATDPEGRCLAPSADLRALLSPETELDDGVPADVRSPDFVAAAAALGRPVEEIGAMLTFTTQSATRLSALVRDDLLTRPVPTPSAFACAYDDTRDWTVCDGTVDVLDYRRPDRTMDPLGDGEPLGEHALPTRVWLPGDGTGGPFPVMFYGHGLSHDRGQGSKVARHVVADGVAVIAVDAVEHGDHPSRTDVPLDALEALTFFGIQFTPPSVDGRLIRDNWRQSTFDKLQVIELLREGFDVDGDGTTDLDPEGMSYVGLSLGAIMGPELLALTDAFDAAVLNVPGGRTSSIIEFSDLFSPLIDVMAPEGTTPGDIDRFFPLIQTLIDPGDAMTWAPHATANHPEILVQIAHLDSTIPNVSNEAVARALGVPGVGAEIWPIADVAFEPGPTSPAGIQQFDTVTRNGGVEAATHDNLMSGDEAWAAIETFLATGEIVDPYSQP